MANHRNGSNKQLWAEIRRGPIAAIYRVFLVQKIVAADLAHEFIAADDAIQSLVSKQPKDSVIYQMFERRLSPQDLRSMVSEHRSAKKSLEVVMVSARLVRKHHEGAAESYAEVVMTAARTAAEAVKEDSIPWHKRTVETEHRAIRQIAKALCGDELEEE